MPLEFQPKPSGKKSHERWVVPCVCVVLVALVWIVFAQALQFGFVNYDDNDNVFGNPYGAEGLSGRGIVWAFTHCQLGRYAPLMTVSYMADSQIHGTGTGGYHFTNVALHAAVAVLLFLVLRAMTGALWRSGFVAAVFAIHPLRAEVVAWVSERGDLLAALFFMLALWSYAHYVRGLRRSWYWSVAGFFAFGLMCKATIVTLPVVLLLLDYWPLGRFEKSAGEKTWLCIPLRLLREKIPLFILSAVSCVVAMLAQQTAVTPIEKLTFGSRVGNALVSYAIYLGQMLWPSGLAAFYPHPQGTLTVWQVFGALMLLGMVCVVVYAGRKRFRYAVVGWGWYLGMLAPMIGILETGAQAHADRYTYLPQIGIYLIVAWGIADLTARWSGRAEILGVCATVTFTLLALCAHGQVATWKDGIALWTNAVESTGPNSRAQNNLGNALLQAGRVDEAIKHLQKALEIDPTSADAHVAMGNALLRQERVQEGIAQYRRAIKLQPNLAKAHTNLGVALQTANQLDEAITEYERALAIAPNLAVAHSNLGDVLRRKGRLDEAIAHLRRALELQPGYKAAQDNLTLTLQQKSGSNP